MITLVMLDIIIKIKEILEDFETFPTSFAVGFYDQLDNRAPKTRRAKMLTYQEFQQDSVRLTLLHLYIALDDPTSTRQLQAL